MAPAPPPTADTPTLPDTFTAKIEALHEDTPVGRGVQGDYWRVEYLDAAQEYVVAFRTTSDSEEDRAEAEAFALAHADSMGGLQNVVIRCGSAEYQIAGPPVTARPETSHPAPADSFNAKVEALLALAQQGADAVAEALRAGRVSIRLPRTQTTSTSATVVKHPTAGLVARNKAAGLETARTIRARRASGESLKDLGDE